jgi:hypothetical protein
MRAVEMLRHRLSLVVRVDDHFSGIPWPDELDVSLSTGERAVSVRGGRGLRHSDGTYRFVGLVPGPKQLRVSTKDGSVFTWDAVTPVTLPLADPGTPLVLEAWPSPRARLGGGVLTVRGKLLSAAAGQQVTVTATGVSPTRLRRTRCDADGEFVFVVVGPVRLNAEGDVELDVAVPGRTLTSIRILDGGANPTFPGGSFAAPPGRELRVLFTLT